MALVRPGEDGCRWRSRCSRPCKRRESENACHCPPHSNCRWRHTCGGRRRSRYQRGGFRKERTKSSPTTGGPAEREKREKNGRERRERNAALVMRSKYFSTSKQVLSIEYRSSLSGHITCGKRILHHSNPTCLPQLRQYVYFCTSKASNLSTRKYAPSFQQLRLQGAAR